MESLKENIHNNFKELRLDKDENFNEFYKSNYNLVYRICFSILKNKENSEDVAQNIFEKIYKMPVEKYPTEYESSWLYTVSKNEALQFIRKTKATVSDDELQDLKDDKNNIEDVIENENYDKLVKKLNKKQEQIVSLKVVSNFTFKEIGEIMSMPTATVQWHYYRSIKYLKIVLSNFAMFLVTFMVGFGIMRKQKNEVQSEKVYEEDNEKATDKSNSESSSSIQTEPQKGQNIDSIISEVEKGSFSETTSKDLSADISSADVIHVGLISISGIFLLLSMIFTIFFIKHQQKLHKKTSKK